MVSLLTMAAVASAAVVHCRAEPKYFFTLYEKTPFDTL